MPRFRFRHMYVISIGAGFVLLGVIGYWLFTGINSQVVPVGEPAPEPGPLITQQITEPRRVPVAGAPGYFVVLNVDGSSDLEAPDGTKTALADAGGLPDVPEAIIKRVTEATLDPPVKTELGNLIVLDDGVVDVPKDAIITFVGPDKVVTHDTDGSSVTYHASGKIERRARNAIPDIPKP